MGNLRKDLQIFYNIVKEDNNIELCEKFEGLIKTESLLSFKQREIEIEEEGFKCVNLIIKSLIKKITKNPICEPMNEFETIRDKVIQESKPHIRPHVVFYINNHFKYLYK